MSNIYRAELLEQELQELLRQSEGILGAVIVSVEGFVIASYPSEFTPNVRGTTQVPQVAAMAATMVALGEQTLGRLAQGKIERLMLEGEYGGILVYPVNVSAALATLVDKETKMGITFVAVAKAAKTLSTILG